MADVKISQLPVATTPLDGTELTPIVQSGTTKRVSVANLTVGRALTASSLTLSTPLSAANGGTGLTSLGTGIATFLETPTSANLAAAVTDETGTGALVFGTSPTFTTSALFPAGTVGAPGVSVSGDTNTGIYFPAADTIGFVEGGVESMRLDASGNLGLGVTPSAWGSGGWIELNSTGVSSRGTLYAAGNTYFNGGWKYSTTAAASLYVQASGANIWYTAPSGTAGNAISFTQAMTLDASGNLGVGTSSPGQKLSVYTSSNSLVIGASIRNDQAGSGVAAIGFNVSSAAAADVSSSKAGIGLVRQNVQGVGSLCFYNSGSTAAGDFTTSDERMRIDASGNVGIGTTSPGFKLDVSGNSVVGRFNGSSTAFLDMAVAGTTNGRFGTNGFATNDFFCGTTGATPLVFVTNNTERARIDSSGNLLVGTTSAGTLLTVNGVATLCSGTATPAGGSTSARLLFGTTAGFGIYYGSGAPTVSAAQGSIYLRSDGSSTSTRLYVNTDGSTTWTNVTTAA